MNNQTTLCHFERLQLLLSNELPAEVESESMEHLAKCSACRERLEALAGDGDWWNEVKSSLSDFMKSRFWKSLIAAEWAPC